MDKKIILRTDITIGKWYCVCACDNLSYLYKIESVGEESILYSNFLDGIKIWIWNTEEEAVEGIKKNAIDMVTKYEMLTEECDKRLRKIKKKMKPEKKIKRIIRRKRK